MSWNVAISISGISSWKYDGSMKNRCAMSDATLSLLVAPDGSVFLTIADTTGRDLVVLNFARYWNDATFGRWTNTILTFEDGASGLFLRFATSTCMEGFEKCCDRILPTPRDASGRPPTLQELGDLGILSLPRIIGDISPDAPSLTVVDTALEAERPESPSASSGDSLQSYDSDELADAYAALGSQAYSDGDDGDEGDKDGKGVVCEGGKGVAGEGEEQEGVAGDGASEPEYDEEDSTSESESDEFESQSLDSDYWNSPLDYDWFALNVVI